MELLKKLGLLTFSCFISLVLFELGFRVYVGISNSQPLEKQLAKSKSTTIANTETTVSLGGLIQPSQWKDVVYELKPNISVVFQNKPVLTNSVGMRENEVTIKKTPGVLRVVGIGDSIMFGWGVQKDETYLSRIARDTSLENKIETLNFAVPGYNTAMEVALYEHRIQAFNPDVIVVQFVNNDFDVPAFMMRQEDPMDFSRSLLWDFISSRLQTSIPKRSGLSAVQTLGKKKPRDQKVLAEYKWMTGESGASRAFRKLRNLAPNVKIFVITGSKTPVQERMLKKLSAELDFKLVQVGPTVDRYIRENNLDNSKEARKNLLTVAPNDRHPNALGHQLIAEALVDAMRDALVPVVVRGGE